jgi:hypothetical protein
VKHGFVHTRYVKSSIRFPSYIEVLPLELREYLKELGKETGKLGCEFVFIAVN